MKQLLKFYFILFLVFHLSISVFSQGNMSENGLYIATLFKEGSQNNIFIHKFLTKELVRKITIASTSSIDEVSLSFSGKYLFARTGTTFFIVDVAQEKIISSIFGAIQVIFSNNEEFYVVLKNNSITKYECETGQLISTMSYPSAKGVFNLKISPNDFIIAAMSVDRIFIYTNEKTDIQKTLAAVDIKFSQDGSYFTVLSIISEKVRVSTYKTSTLYLERTADSDVLLSNQSPQGELIPIRCTISNDGQYVAFYTAKNFKIEIFVYETRTNKLVWIVNNFANTKNELFPQNWSISNNLVAYGQNLMAGEYFLAQKQSIALGLRIDDFNLTNDLSENMQLVNRKISSDFYYVAIQSGKDLYIRDSRLPNKKMILQDVEFICYSPDSKYVFVKKDNTVNAIVLSQLTTSLNNGINVKFYTFDRTLSTIVNESIITDDIKPPKGYAFFYVNNTKQIVKVDTAKLRYAFKSTKMNGNEVELQVNLVDANGNQFIGATDPSWEYIWCNLLIQNPNGEVTQINDFKVEEVNESVSTAYALVLDHSGSMGTKRANALQYGAWDLVGHKRPQDAYLLIKYDNHVSLINNLTKDKYPIQRYLNNSGVVGFGGGTALVDATLLAAKKLAKSNDYAQKSIILFTDGYENASMYTKFDLLNTAKINGIEINVVGFGDKINEEYLKSLAYNTGGMYVHLYKTDDLKTIFRDVDYKRKNYYSITFKTKVLGKHIAFLQLCQDQFKHDSIWIPFDNSVQQKRIDEANPILPLEPKQIKLTNFNKFKIPINPPMKPVKSQKVNDEFSNINFPNIQFATASDVIVSSEKQGIDEIVEFMRKYPYVFLDIHGHTDNQGDKDFNLDLSNRRAQAAKDLIVKAGIAPGRIIIRGYGDTNPLMTNDTEEGRAKNRRIEFFIFIQK